jgi:glycosyltransferase involved in cell wall biosynthesis
MNDHYLNQSPSLSDNPKRIVGVISFMNIGGAQSALLRLARSLRARGYLVEVWCLYEKSPPGIGEDHLITFSTRPRLSFLDYFKVYIRLVSRFRQVKPDAVIGFLPLGNIFGLSAAALAGIPRRIASQRSPGTTYGKIARALDRLLGVTNIYHSIVCVSEGVRASFADYPRQYCRKLSVIYLGIDWIPSELDRVSARKRLGLPPEGPLIIAVGRLEKQKNHSLLINVLANIKNVHVAIAGEGTLRKDLEILATSSGVSDRITFLGRLDQESVRHLFKAADIFVQPSLYEGQGNALLEAMHAGLPVIVSDLPVHRESLCDGSDNPAGMLVPLEDIDGWVSTLRRVIDDPQYAKSTGMHAMKLVQKRFPLDRMIDEFEKVLTG